MNFVFEDYPTTTNSIIYLSAVVKLVSLPEQPYCMSGTDIRDSIDGLKDSSPQKFGFIRNNWKYAKQGLDDTHRNYARTEHIFSNISDPDIDIRTLGQTLEILSNLGIIKIEFKTSNTVLYNMESYENEKFEPIIELFE